MFPQPIERLPLPHQLPCPFVIPPPGAKTERCWRSSMRISCPVAKIGCRAALFAMPPVRRHNVVVGSSSLLNTKCWSKPMAKQLPNSCEMGRRSYRLPRIPQMGLFTGWNIRTCQEKRTGIASLCWLVMNYLAHNCKSIVLLASCCSWGFLKVTQHICCCMHLPSTFDPMCLSLCAGPRAREDLGWNGMGGWNGGWHEFGGSCNWWVGCDPNASGAVPWHLASQKMSKCITV